MPFPEFNPVLLQLGPLAIRWYALAYIAGILLGWRYASALTRRPSLWPANAPPLTEAKLDDLVLWITAGVILGGRLGYVLFYEPTVIWRTPLEIVEVWHGGMSFHGGLIGVCVALFLYARHQQVDLVQLGDLVAPCVPIGLFFGRIANFINGELWGRPTNVPWGIVFCNAHLRAANAGICPAGMAPRHPSQLYEAALEGVGLFLLLRWSTHRRRWLRRPGTVSGLFLIGYGAVRITLETVRNPDLSMPTFPFGLTMGMILSVPLLVFGVVLTCSRRSNPH